MITLVKFRTLTEHGQVFLTVYQIMCYPKKVTELGRRPGMFPGGKGAADPDGKPEGQDYQDAEHF